MAKHHKSIIMAKSMNWHHCETILILFLTIDCEIQLPVRKKKLNHWFYACHIFYLTVDEQKKKNITRDHLCVGFWIEKSSITIQFALLTWNIGLNITFLRVRIVWKIDKQLINLYGGLEFKCCIVYLNKLFVMHTARSNFRYIWCFNERYFFFIENPLNKTTKPEDRA